MKLLGLKGFTSWGRIDSFFTEGCFPTKFNWTGRDVSFVHQAYAEQYGDEEYIAICYSDGGTVGHRIFLADRKCLGLIAVGSLFPKGLESYLPINSHKHVLLIANEGDRTGMGRHTQRAHDFYYLHKLPVELVKTQSMSWHKHDFAPSIPVMQAWTRRKFGYELPIKH